MKDYRITKEQILELHESNSPETRIQIAKMFPEAFKKELEIGKWYKMKGDANFLCNFNGNNGNSYGFNLKKEWMDNSMCFQNFDIYIEATPQEVKTALIEEAKKRGYKKGNFKCLLSRESEFSENYNKWYFEMHTNALYTKSLGEGGACIFKNGKWSEISHPGKQVISMREALKIIAKKLKVSPEDIKIEQYEKTL